MATEIEKILIGRKVLKLDLGDITRVRTDAIVNAANKELSGGGGVDEAIHKAAGPELMRACQRYQGCPTGSAIITESFKLPVSRVIHTVGPIWQGGDKQEAELLASAYQSSLELANKNSIVTVAFPSISTGAYGYPIEKAAKIAIHTVKSYLAVESVIDEVTFVLHDEKTFLIYQRALADSEQNG